MYFAHILNKMNVDRILFFLNIFSINKKFIVGNALRYLLEVDLLNT